MLSSPRPGSAGRGQSPLRYRAAFRAEDGRLLPAGEFIGLGDKTLKSNMQAALLRDDTTGFVVTNETGRVVLTADL